MPTTALSRHASAQARHLMQRLSLMTWAFLRSPVIALVGHFVMQTPQPLHLIGSMEGLSSALQRPARQRF